MKFTLHSPPLVASPPLPLSETWKWNPKVPSYFRLPTKSPILHCRLCTITIIASSYLSSSLWYGVILQFHNYVDNTNNDRADSINKKTQRHTNIYFKNFKYSIASKLHSCWVLESHELTKDMLMNLLKNKLTRGQEIVSSQCRRKVHVVAVHMCSFPLSAFLYSFALSM